MEEIISGKNILITGGTGSIGRELVKQVLAYNPRQIRIFSRDQSKQLFLQYELGVNEKVRYLIGDIRDRERLALAMQEIDIVFHAAALKHVVSCEYNPFEAVKTNVIGLQNVIEEAIKNKVQRFVYISTDKAANPINIMGSTKALGEKLVSNAYYYQGAPNTIFSSVRFGNVLNSDGSVIPIFKKQIVKGGPLTMTDPEMKRFFMSIPQAARLVLSALKYSQVNEIFVLKMPVMKIKDLAHVMIEELAPKSGFQPEEIQIQTMGKKEGEKLNEQLMTEEEAAKAIETEEFFVIKPELFIPYKKEHIPEYSLPQDMKLFNSEGIAHDTSRMMSISREEIKQLLKDAKAL